MGPYHLQRMEWTLTHRMTQLATFEAHVMPMSFPVTKETHRQLG